MSARLASQSLHCLMLSCTTAAGHHRAITGPSQGHHRAITGPSQGHHRAITGPSQGHHGSHEHKPVAKAGASFQARICCGKFHGRISATTPIGSCRVYARKSPGIGIVMPLCLSAHPYASLAIHRLVASLAIHRLDASSQGNLQHSSDTY